MRPDKTPGSVMGKSSKYAGSFLSRKGEAPGPGAYAKKIMETGPKYGFGSSKRSGVKEESVPGPGQYKVLPMIGN